MSDADWSTAVRAVAERFVREHYPSELPWFGVLWDRLSLTEMPRARPLPWYRRLLRRLPVGLGLNQEQLARLDSVLVILAVREVMRNLAGVVSTPTLTQVHDGIHACACSFGAPARTASVLADGLATDLQKLLAVLTVQPVVPGGKDAVARPKAPPDAGQPASAVTGAAEAQPEAAASADFIDVVMLREGKDVLRTRYTKRYAKSMPARYEFDVVVDETSHELHLRGVGSKEIHDISGMQRGMLWLVLTHVGGYVEHADIRQLFEMPAGAECYQYRAQLGDLLGEKLLNRVMPEGTEKRYVIPKSGWSFCWLRPAMDPRPSELLYRIPRPVKK